MGIISNSNSRSSTVQFLFEMSRLKGFWKHMRPVCSLDPVNYMYFVQNTVVKRQYVKTVSHMI